MKKSVMIILAVLLLTVSAAFAQETETVVLSFYTVGSLFNWGDNAEDIYNYLSQFEGLDVEIDDELYAVTATAESDEEYFTYYFYFDEETESLYGIECAAALSDAIDPEAVLNELKNVYGLENAEAYQDKPLAAYIANFDKGYLVAGSGTIAAIGVSNAKDDSLALVGLYFLDRGYYEGNDPEIDLPDLDFSTVGTLFNWGDKAEDVYNFLSRYKNLEVKPDEGDYTITASAKSENDEFSYIFWFDENTEGLYGLQCISILSDELDPAEILKSLITEYGLENADLYEDEDMQKVVADYDGGVVVATPSTIVAIAGNESTPEKYGVAAIYFFDRNYYESL